MDLLTYRASLLKFEHRGLVLDITSAYLQDIYRPEQGRVVYLEILENIHLHIKLFKSLPPIGMEIKYNEHMPTVKITNIEFSKKYEYILFNISKSDNHERKDN